ncbi:MAG: PEGA domain-containing protein [Candidatus Saccharimonadales bacterium]
MDYLDSQKRRAHKIRLMIGYGLMSVAIGLATIILVYAAYGYGINTKTGEVVQNGLLFADSRPSGAKISLNGQDKDADTAARLVLPAGSYYLTLSKEGYRNWQRNFLLNEHSVARFAYPFLFPVAPIETAIKSYEDMPELFSQSPNLKWLLIESTAGVPARPSFDLYDTDNLSDPPQSLTLPVGLLTGYASSSSKFTEVEWAADNRHLLVKHTGRSGHEFIVIDRADPAQSFNVNKLFKVPADDVALADKKIGQFYIFDKAAATLALADRQSANLTGTVIREVLAFKAISNNLLTYVSPAIGGNFSVRIWDNGQTYSLTSLEANSDWLLAATTYQSHWYYMVGAKGSERLSIYKDPLSSLKDSKVAKAQPMLALQNIEANSLAVSDNGRFFGAQSGQMFLVFDVELEESYRYQLEAKLNSPMSWLDGFRWAGQAGGNLLISDYDGSNSHLLGATASPLGYFSRDVRHLLVIRQTGSANTQTLIDIDMRAGNDLPEALRSR